MKQIAILFFVCMGLSSCFEVFEEIQLKKDGTGNFVYTVNLSQSKAEINAALKFDSFMGSKLPSLEKMKSDIQKAKLLMSQQPGLTNVVGTEDYTNYIFELKGSFDKLESFNTAIKKVAKIFGANEAAIDQDFNYTQKDSLYSRSVAHIEQKWIAKSTKLLGQKAQQAKYTCVIKSDQFVAKVNSPIARISPSKKNVLISATAAQILQNPGLLNIQIIYSK